MRPGLIFTLGILVLLIPTLVYLYLLWPFPGSQDLESIGFLYALDGWLRPLQLIGGLIALVSLGLLLRRRPGRRALIGVAVALVLVGLVFFGTGKLSARQLFKPFETVTFAQGTSDALPETTLVMGVVAGDEAKAYPMRLLAYHHRVEDTLGGEPVWVTYCTMCRTGKVFRPTVDGRPLHFDLLGAIRYNSTYRDVETGSWWYQANGRAITGPLAGKRLTELRADQMPLGRWLELHPDSLVLQPDPAASEGYKMFGFDTLDEKRSDPERPQGWQWVVGIEHGGVARAYLWSLLAERRLVQDTVGELPVAIHLSGDLVSHRVWDRRLDGRVLDFKLDTESDRLIDDASGSSFGFDGVAVDGELAGRSLTPVLSTVEFWHSFENFSNAELYTDPAASAENPG